MKNDADAAWRSHIIFTWFYNWNSWAFISIVKFFQNKVWLLTLFEKSNFCPIIQFWQNPNIFTSFSPKFFLTIFLVKSKLSTAKNSKTTTISRVFHLKKIDNFLGKSKVEFLDKKWRFRTVCAWGRYTQITVKVRPFGRQPFSSW